MPRKKVLITVTTYPLPSRSYDELVCTAGMLESGEWIRIYPVPFSFLGSLKGKGLIKNTKYTVIELDLQKRSDDFRPESYSPANYDFGDLKVIEHLDTAGNWFKRKQRCLKDVYTDMNKLVEDSKDPTNRSLATFKPTEIISFHIKEEKNREWKDEWKALRVQGDLFAPEQDPENMFPKLPYRFYYRFKDANGKISKMMIEDWEIGALYWNCVERAQGNEQEALEKVRLRYEVEFMSKKDIHLFLGTTKEWHQRRGNNPFLIIGVFYPKKELQQRLF